MGVAFEPSLLAFVENFNSMFANTELKTVCDAMAAKFIFYIV